MKVVVLSLADPWAASHGGTIRTRALVRSVAALGHEVVTAFTCEPGTPATAPGPAGGVPDGVQVLGVPSSTVGNRAWPAPVKRAKRLLLPLPTTLGARSRALGQALQGLTDVDLLLVSVLPYAQYLEQLPGARLWVDHSDLYSDVVGREASGRRGIARVTAGLQHGAVRRSELRLTRQAAVTTTAGHADAVALGARSGRAVSWLPTPVAFQQVPRDPRARPVAGFLGNFHYWPNLDAWELLRDVWAPRLDACGWDVVVAGLASERLPAQGNIQVLGAVGSVADFYRRVDVTVAPVRVGGGMKVKVVESLSHGRPVVATPFAVAGFPGGLAGAVTVVDPARPDFAALRDGVPALPAAAAAALDPFRAEAFQETVDHLLGSLPATRRGPVHR